MERESARRSPSKGRERAIVKPTNIGTVLKAKLGKCLRDGVERILARVKCVAITPVRENFRTKEARLFTTCKCAAKGGQSFTDKHVM